LNENFGSLSIFGFVDALGQECNLSNPPRCACAGGIKNMSLILSNDDTTGTYRTVNVYANALHSFLLGTFYVQNGDEFLVNGSILPGGKLLTFTYVEIVGNPGGDIKLNTICGRDNLVGEFFSDIYVASVDDSIGNKCADYNPGSPCPTGYEILCHRPRGNATGDPAINHCVKRREVQSRLSSSPTWTLGPCTPLSRFANPDENLVDSAPFDRIADGKVELNAFPNPFNQSTTIWFRMPISGNVKLTVYSITGQEVSNLYKGEILASKDYKFEFKAANHPYGLYFYRLETDEGKVFTNKMVLTK
jgi:hypothetical protein